MASEIAAGMRRAAKEMHGIVVSAGLMDKTVKVRLGGQRWEQRVHKVRVYPSHVCSHRETSLAQSNPTPQPNLLLLLPTSQKSSPLFPHVPYNILTPSSECPVKTNLSPPAHSGSKTPATSSSTTPPTRCGRATWWPSRPRGASRSTCGTS